MMEKIYKMFQKFRTTGFFDIFGSSVMVKIISFLSAIILVRIVSKQEYGIFTYSWNIYSILMLFSGFGATSAILQIACEYPNDYKERKKIYQYGCSFGTKVNIIFCLALILIGLFYPFKIKEASFMLCIMCLLPLVQYWNEYQSIYLRGERKNREYSLLNILSAFLVLVFSVAGAFLVREKGFVISRYLAFGILVFMGIKLWRVPLSFGRSQLSDEIKVSFRKIALISMVNIGLSQLLYLLDVFVLGAVVPDSAVIASYKVATTIPTALSFIPSSLATYIYPYFVEHREDKKWCLKRYFQILAGMGVFNLILSGGLILCAEPVVRIIYGEQYLDAVIPFRILSVSYFFSGTFRTIAGNLTVTQRKLGFNLFVAVFSGSVNIVADVILISQMGSVGAAYATLSVVILTSVLNVSYLIYLFKNKK